MSVSLAHVAPYDQELSELQRVFDLQKKTQLENPYPSLQKRKEQLSKLSRAAQKHKKKLKDALEEDFGSRGLFESLGAEVMSIPQACQYQIKHIGKWMKPDKRPGGPLGLLGKASLTYKPKGVVGIISPWNYPVHLAGSPLAGALGAGNRVILKMSEFTPSTGIAFKEMIQSVFPEEEVFVINGEANVAIEFTKLPWDHLLFTGATSIGKHVMKAAAENLTPVTLELGGKSPAIIDSDVSMQESVERIANGKLLNAGQTCIAPDYILCPEHRVNEFVSAMVNTASKMFPTISANSNYTSIINERQLERLKSHVKDAENKGANVIQVNPAKESFADGKKFPLHLVVNPTEDMTVLQEEIFGPILPILTYQTIDEAIQYINERPTPLALYYFGYDKRQQDHVLERTQSGGVCINDTVTHIAVEDAPFGGIGPSGMGAYHGPEGFKTFSHARTVLVRGKFNAMKAMYPPHNKGLSRFILAALKR